MTKLEEQITQRRKNLRPLITNAEQHLARLQAEYVALGNGVVLDDSKLPEFEKVYAVLSISDLTDMIAIIKKGTKRPTTRSCGVFTADVKPDRNGQLQISSVDLFLNGRAA